MITQFSEQIETLVESGDLIGLLATLNEQAETAQDFVIDGLWISAALQRGFTTMATALVNAPQFNAVRSGAQLLSEALALGHLGIAELLISKGCQINTWSENNGSPLLQSLDHEYFPLAEQLINAGAELSIRDDKGWTPLIWAALTGREKVVDFLLSHQADVHPCNNDGWNAITGAYVKGHLSIVEKLRAKGAYFGDKYANAVLLSAYKDSQMDLFQKLITEGANTNITNTEGTSLLTLAIARGDNKSLTLLLEHGADVEAIDAKGETCLQAALELANYNAAIALIEAGANPNHAGRMALSPLHYAANNGNHEICQLLLTKGAAINQPTSKKALTALMLAAKRNHLATVKVLHEAGADLNLRNEKGETARKIVGEYGLPPTPMNESGSYLKKVGAQL